MKITNNVPINKIVDALEKFFIVSSEPPFTLVQ